MNGGYAAAGGRSRLCTFYCNVAVFVLVDVVTVPRAQRSR